MNLYVDRPPLNGRSIYGSNRWGSYGKVSYCFRRYAQKHWSSGSTLSGHCMTTGFGPFELPNHGLLQKEGGGGGGGRPLPTQGLKSPALGWHSQSYEYLNY